ncbi:MAG: hypothetical protein P8Z71_03485 [Candidatus Sulfobium sp.]
MSETGTYSFFAVSYELNKREFRRKLGLFPEEMRYYVILANSVIGSENAKRLAETPEAVVEDSAEFVSKLLSMVGPAEDHDGFREVAETYLIETIRDELRYSCQNCENFGKCLDLENLTVGLLFKRRANGEETDRIKKEITLQVDKALKRTPYIDTDVAHELCKDFRHQYRVSTIGEVFGRYSDIALELQRSFGLDYGKIQKRMIEINMEFCEKCAGANNSQKDLR